MIDLRTVTWKDKKGQEMQLNMHAVEFYGIVVIGAILFVLFQLYLITGKV